MKEIKTRFQYPDILRNDALIAMKEQCADFRFISTSDGNKIFYFAGTFPNTEAGKFDELVFRLKYGECIIE